MNKIFKVKRNAFGQSVVCSEITKSRTKGHVVASALAVALAGMMASGGVYALTALEGAKDTGAGILAVGENADAVAKYAIAIGDRSIAKQLFSIAIGGGSINDSAGSIALGLNSYIKGRGSDNSGNQGNNIAIGRDAQVAGETPVIGDFSNINLNNGYSENSIAIGYSSQVKSGMNALAIGAYSETQGRGTALGPNSMAKGTSVAIGYAFIMQTL
ncbi:hypothetical protein HZ320_10115 [[Pasteurella] aerogenes]|nr:hypothetical protein HZ320_10115 [[Pasteurella] aerogenes]